MFAMPWRRGARRRSIGRHSHGQQRLSDRAVRLHEFVALQVWGVGRGSLSSFNDWTGWLADGFVLEFTEARAGLGPNPLRAHLQNGLASERQEPTCNETCGSKPRVRAIEFQRLESSHLSPLVIALWPKPSKGEIPDEINLSDDPNCRGAYSFRGTLREARTCGKGSGKTSFASEHFCRGHCDWSGIGWKGHSSGPSAQKPRHQHGCRSGVREVT